MNAMTGTDTGTITPQEMNALTGQVIGTSEWFEMSQERVNLFAQATGDFQFIHVDPEKAKLTPFGGTIAHGFLTLSMLPVMLEKSDCPQVSGVKMAVNYGGNKTRFLAPVRTGKRIRGVFKLLDLDEKRPGQWQQTIEMTIEVEGEAKTALICEWITQFFV
jgi:acyl dehydratase